MSLTRRKYLSKEGRRPFKTNNRQLKMEQSMNILIVKLSSLGDVIHALPALNALRKGFPHSHITWLVEDYAAQIVLDHPSLDRVLVFTRKRWFQDIFLARESIKTLREIVSFVWGLRQRNYDLVIDLQGLLKSGIMVWLSGGQMRVGYDRTREMSYLFINERIPPFDPDRHAIERYLHLARAAGAEYADLEYGIRVEKGDHGRVEALLRDHGIHKEDRVVLISPFARWETKLWEPDRFSGLCDRLIERYSVKVVFTGTSGEKEYVKRIIGSMRHSAFDLAGKTCLKEMACLCSRSNLMISTDTGSMHLAAAMGLPVVALFGPTAPWRTGPYGEGHSVIRKDLACSPCFKRRCESKECMRAIEVEEVLERTAPYLNNNGQVEEMQTGGTRDH